MTLWKLFYEGFLPFKLVGISMMRNDEGYGCEKGLGNNYRCAGLEVYHLMFKMVQIVENCRHIWYHSENNEHFDCILSCCLMLLLTDCIDFSLNRAVHNVWGFGESPVCRWYDAMKMHSRINEMKRSYRDTVIPCTEV